MELNFNPFPKLETERLILRCLVFEDENEIFAIRSSLEMSKYLDRPLCNSIEEAQKFISMINDGIIENKWIYWAIALKGQLKLIGTICLWQFDIKNKKAEIGFELLPEFQGKGLMFEAAHKIINYGFDIIKLKAIYGEVDPNNQRSIKLLKKLNFIGQDLVKDIKAEKEKEITTVIYKLNI